MSARVALDHVGKRFAVDRHEVVALEDISLCFQAGEVVMVVGPSGCGKSTLLNMIAGLDFPSTGAIEVDAAAVRAPGPDRAMIFQDGALFPWLTVRQNVEFGLKQQGMAAKARSEKARAMLAVMGLSAFEDRSISELSGGMRQRVAIARALVLRPKVLLMDEPFSALDAMTREELYALMQRLWSDRATTVVFVTHNVREAVTLGSRVVIMSPRPGRVKRVFDVDIPGPRRIDDPAVAALAKQISDAMRAEVGAR